MADIDDITEAIGCLSIVFPQFVSKELSSLTDQIITGVQAFTDPLAAIGDLSTDSLISKVGELSSNDIFGGMASVASGLASQFVRREADELLAEMATEEESSISKRVKGIRNLSGKIVTSVSMMMTLFADMPYAAAQRMCETIIEADELKAANLTCLNKHITQLVNAIMVLGKSTSVYVDETFEDLAEASAKIEAAQELLTLSQLLVNGSVVFDSEAFGRARDALLDASALLTPDKDGTSQLDRQDIADFGSVEAAAITKADRRLTLLVVPSLISLIESEVGAYASQVNVINFYVKQLGQLIANFRRVGQASRVKTQRARAIAGMQSKLTEILGRIDLAISRQSLRAASGEMLLWSSRVKTIIATMDQVKLLELQEGSIEGPDKALVLEQAFQALLLDLTAISNGDATSLGIENPLLLRDQVLSLTKAARRVMKDIEEGRATESKLATLHGLASATATGQSNRIEQSITVASLQKIACEKFASIELGFTKKYDQMIDSMRQLGLDRGVDMLSSGAFEEFLSSDVEQLSYIGKAIECLKHGIDATDDQQTRQQMGEIRDDLVGQRSNLDIASTDSSDSGLSRMVGGIKKKMSTLQRNAKTIESIVADLKGALAKIGGVVDESLDGIAQFNAFLGDLDHLSVGAGGRLAAGLEEHSDHPRAGVVNCD
jgi:hypothetical protein